MTQAYRSAQEQELLSVRALERRIANLERAGAGLVSIMQKASAQLVLTAAFQDVVGTAVTIVRPGRYAVFGNFDVFVTVAAAGGLVTGTITATGATVSSVVNGFAKTDNINQFQTVVSFGTYTFASAGTVTLQAKKSGGTATIESANLATGLLVIRTGPA